jgi:hypothetical protein
MESWQLPRELGYCRRCAQEHSSRKLYVTNPVSSCDIGGLHAGFLSHSSFDFDGPDRCATMGRERHQGKGGTMRDHKHHPDARVFLTNLRVDMPLSRNIWLVFRNNMKRILTASTCCGNPVNRDAESAMMSPPVGETEPLERRVLRSFQSMPVTVLRRSTRITSRQVPARSP